MNLTSSLTDPAPIPTEQIREALEGDPGDMALGFHLAADLLNGLTTTCETCGGLGWRSWDEDVRTCPDCAGRGWLLDPDRLEASVKAAFPDTNAPSVIKHRIKAAVLAYLEPPT